LIGTVWNATLTNGTQKLKFSAAVQLVRNKTVVTAVQKTKIVDTPPIIIDMTTAEIRNLLGMPSYPEDIIALSDEGSNLVPGAVTTVHRVIGARTLTSVRIACTTAPVGAPIIVDVRKNGTTIFNTQVRIDAGETTSVTASIPAVLSTTSFADDDEVRWYIIQVGSTSAGTGLKGALIWA
jgi:hypothetical protein